MIKVKEKVRRVAAKTPRVASRERRRSQILKAAARLFAEKSFHDVTMEEVAHEVGVAKGTLYIYFESKEKLYLGILENAFEELVDLIENEIAKDDPAPEKLAKVLKLIYGYYSQNKDVLRILSRDETHLIREHYELTEQWRGRGVKLYKRIIQKGIKEGTFRPINPTLAALMIYGVVRSVTFYYDAHKSPEKVAEEVCSVLTKGILAGERKETKT